MSDDVELFQNLRVRKWQRGHPACIVIEFSRDITNEEIEALPGALMMALSAKTSRWISVSEIKPDDGQTVMGYWPEPLIFQSTTFHAKDAPDSRESWSDVFDDYIDEPTHWMPLPEAPK